MKQRMNNIKCPVCNNFTFPADDFPGSHIICSLCVWEDDDVQYYNPEFKGGANEVSLNQAKRNFKLYGISDPSIKNWHKNV